MADARYVFRVSQMTLGEAMDLFPTAKPDEINANWAIDGVSDHKTSTYLADNSNSSFRDAYPVDASILGETGRPQLTLADMVKEITVVEMLWKEVIDIYRDKNGYEFTIYNPEKAPLILDNGMQPFRRKEKTFRTFLGAEGLLEAPIEPLCPSGQLPILPTTCYYDEYDSRYYGLMEAGTDAQLSINKLYANYMYALDFTSKGGYIVQKDAIGDQKAINQFENTIADPGKVTPVDNLQGIMPKPTGNIPKDMFELF